MRTHCTSIWVQAFSWLLGGNVSHGTNNVLNKYVYVCVGNFSHGPFHYIARARTHPNKPALILHPAHFYFR